MGKKKKKKYHVYGTVQGSKYLGEFEAESPEEARKMALEGEKASVSLCWQCSEQCEDAEIIDATVEED